jgi:chromate transporter
MSNVPSPTDVGETDAARLAGATVPHPTFSETTRTFLKIGLLSFGGPAGQIALMHKTLVEEKRWISEERFLHALNYCMLLPGPEAQQLATYIGWLLHGVRGGVMAGLLFIIPGFVIILLLSTVYALFQRVPVVEAVFFGLKAAVLAIVIEAVIRIGKRALKNQAMIAIAALSFVAIFALQVPFPLIILGAAIIGYLGTRFAPSLFEAAGHAATSKVSGPFVELREPATDRSWTGALRVIALWGGIWAAPVAVAALVFGPASVFMDIAQFFSKMAVVTFGGAYAVLAYVAQEAVALPASGGLGWLKPGEMLDGLALAETTPGPLILVLTYVGFLAAFRAPPGIDPLFAGVLGATLTTWVTFAPCFLFIFLGAPYIEQLRSNRALSAALAAITAAVVGVVLNLAIWFALHVLFREVGTFTLGPLAFASPRLGTVDWAAVALGLAAMLAVLRFKLGMLPTLAGCALGGLMVRAVLGW